MNNYLEDMQYQFRPFFYLTIASVCFKYSHDYAGFGISAGLLTAAALYILKERYIYRYCLNN